MICPKCGAQNPDSRFHCTVCGSTLNKSQPAESSNKKTTRMKFPVILIILLGIVGLALGWGMLFVLNKIPPWVIWLGGYLALGAAAAGLWIRRVNRQKVTPFMNSWTYRVLLTISCLAAWPLVLFFYIAPRVEEKWRSRFKALSLGMMVMILTVVSLILLVRGQISKEEKERQDNLNQREASINQLAQTWGENVRLCDQAGPVYATSSVGSVPKKVLLIDSSDARMVLHPGQALIPKAEQAGNGKDLTWLVCLTQVEMDLSCKYQTGGTLPYKRYTLYINLFYIPGRTQAYQDMLFSTPNDFCPSEITLVDGKVKFVTDKDGKSIPRSELHLDETPPTFEQVYARVSEIIAMLTKATKAPIP